MSRGCTRWRQWARRIRRMSDGRLAWPDAMAREAWRAWLFIAITRFVVGITITAWAGQANAQKLESFHYGSWTVEINTVVSDPAFSAWQSSSNRASLVIACRPVECLFLFSPWGHTCSGPSRYELAIRIDSSTDTMVTPAYCDGGNYAVGAITAVHNEAFSKLLKALLKGRSHVEVQVISQGKMLPGVGDRFSLDGFSDTISRLRAAKAPL